MAAKKPKDENVKEGIRFPAGAKYAFKVEGQYKTKDGTYKSYSTVLFDDSYAGHSQQKSKMRRNIIPHILRQRYPDFSAEITSDIITVIPFDGKVDSDNIFNMTRDELVEHILDKGKDIKHALFSEVSDLRNAVVLYNDSKEAFARFQDVREKQIGTKVDLMKFNTSDYINIDVQDLGKKNTGNNNHVKVENNSGKDEI